MEFISGVAMAQRWVTQIIMHTQLAGDSYTILKEYASQMNQIKENSQASRSLVAKPGEDKKD